MTIDFYYVQGSPPCTLVSLTIAALNIESKIKYHFLDFIKADYLKPEFVKINPQHTTPTIVDDGFVLWESRSIAKYLLVKYGDKKLYPEDIRTRALIDQRLDFDIGTIFASFKDYYYPYVFGKTLEEEKLKLVKDALGFFNTFLDGSKFAAGSELTLADLALSVTVSCISAFAADVEEYPNIVRWLKLVKSTAPYVEDIVEKCIHEFKRDLPEFRLMCINYMKSSS
ncbi:glutathione S-transferase 1-like [Battus philenor]|uniref:glutathione S-transferase 1-like n=1 Tax=Battus philenor TaxID=42288 RepID=UPI0035D0D2E0